MMPTSHTYLLLIVGIVLCFTACERDITVELPQPETKIVVEGRIEVDLPPVVILTKNIPYFAAINRDEMLDTLFVRDAEVYVSDGEQTVQLVEYIQEVGEGIETIVYTDPNLLSPSIRGAPKKTYQLTVIKGSDTLRSTTYLPARKPLDSLWYRQPEEDVDDELVTLMCRYADPDTLGDYIRYFTFRNPPTYDPNTTDCVPAYINIIGSFKPGYIFDDRYYNGQTFDFPLDRGQQIDEPVDLDTYGYFLKGDTIVVKWCAIPKAHFDFWETWEYSVIGFENPFSAPTRIESNIENGLGIWGGYACDCHSLVVPE